MEIRELYAVQGKSIDEILFSVHEEVEVGVIKSYLLAIWKKRMARMREINRE